MIQMGKFILLPNSSNQTKSMIYHITGPSTAGGGGDLGGMAAKMMMSCVARTTEWIHINY